MESGLPQSGPPVRRDLGAAPLARPAVPLDPLEYTEDVPPAAPRAGARQFAPRVLLYYRWSIAATFVLVAALGAAAVWVVFPPIYRATAKVEVSPVIPQLVESRSDMVPMYESYRSSQVEHITSTTVLDSVLDDPNVQATRWYRGIAETPLDKVLAVLDLRNVRPARDRLAEALEVTAPKGKYHVYVAMNAFTPGEARVIVDTVVNKYQQFTEREFSERDASKLRSLERFRTEKRLELTDENSRAKEYRTRLRTGSPDELLTERVIRLDELTAEWQKLEVRIAALDNVPGASQPATATAPVAAAPDPHAAPTETLASSTLLFQNDPQWQRLNDASAQARLNLDRAKTQFGELHPAMEALQKQVDYAVERLKERETDLAKLPRAAGPSGLADVVTLKGEALALQEVIAIEEKRHDELMDLAEKLRDTTARIADLEAAVAQLDNEIERTRMNQEVAGRIRTWKAYEPTGPADDRRPKMLLGALAGAAAAALGLAFLRFRASTTVNEAVEAAADTRSPILGVLPLQRRSGEDQPPHLVAAQQEAVRVLRTALLRRLNTLGGQVVQITSAGPASGKSTLAELLARSLAVSGKRVLLVDADLRKASLSKRFEVTGSAGLVDTLARADSAMSAVQTTTLPGLSLLSAGTWSAAEELELLANGALASAISTWRTHFDVVLFDSGPLLGMADSLILSRQVDGTVLVVRERHCHREALAAALESLGAAGGRLLGTVFIGSPSLSSAYGYGYGYGRIYTAQSGSLDVGEARA